MTRCATCTKSFRNTKGESWQYGLCSKCWKKNRQIQYNPIKINTRLTNTAVDFYLDLYVLREVENIDN